MPTTDAMHQRQHVWTRYWAGGAAHSCATSFGEHYEGAIAAFWRRILDDTPGGARLLDVATGSGAIPRLWRSWRSTDVWDAVDLASHTPPWAAEAGEGLRYHPAVPAESLPFPAASFDLVTSQYGLEYCDLARAVPELLRVRASQGSVALVLHHVASRPVELARTELGHLDWAQSPDGLITACARMLDLAALATTPEGRRRLAQDPAAEAARVCFNAAQVALRQRAEAVDGADVLGEITDGVGALLQLAMQQGAAQAHASLASWRTALNDHRWRLKELCDHALDRPKMQALADQLSAVGLRTEAGTVDEGPHLMGWSLRGTPPR